MPVVMVKGGHHLGEGQLEASQIRRVSPLNGLGDRRYEIAAEP
jgi:hypothetical protein